jgi:hypothetical protein
MSRFANHTQKLIRSSQQHRRNLTEMADASRGVAPIRHSPENAWDALHFADRFAEEAGLDRPTLFGSYFAHHTLRHQAELSRDLFRECYHQTPGHRAIACHHIHERHEVGRREWISALLQVCLRSSEPQLEIREYAAFNVGALTDYEDVDLAIVAASAKAQESLSKAFASVTKTFVRYASKIQLYVTEEFKVPQAGARLEEFDQLLSAPKKHIVSVMQLLSAQFLSGSPGLARSLRTRIVLPFYETEGLLQDGFLRSVIPEIEYHLSRTDNPGFLCPKQDIYLPIKLATTAMRLANGVMKTRPVEALHILATKDQSLSQVYQELADVFVQGEVLRWLMYLYVSPDQQFNLHDDRIRQASLRVGTLLGLSASARRSSENRLIGAYEELRARTRTALRVVVDRLRRHVERTSTLRHLVESGASRTDSGNFAESLLHSLEGHEQEIVWDDVVTLLRRRRPAAERLRRDFLSLSLQAQRTLGAAYIDRMMQDVPAIFEFLDHLTVMERSQDRNHPETVSEQSSIAGVFWQALLERLESNEAAVRTFSESVERETTPSMHHRLVKAFPRETIERFCTILEQSDVPTQRLRVARAFRTMLVLVHHHSNALARTIDRVLDRTPEFIERIGDNRGLNELARRIRTTAAHEPSPDRQIELLGDALDTIALRAALVSIMEGRPAHHDGEFTDAVDTYVRELFKACFREIRQRSPILARFHPGQDIALFSTGGYGRKEAFGNDWDYIAIVRENDRGLKKFCSKVVQRFSSAMTRRGLLPHNRFADHFNAYAVTIPEIQTYLEGRPTAGFIDEAEILEARFVFGDQRMAHRFRDEVRSLVIGPHRKSFVLDLVQEIQAHREHDAGALDLKNGPGGIREINLLLLAIEAEFRPSSLSTSDLGSLPPPLSKHVRFLRDSHEELRRIRDLYRLLVASNDKVEIDRLVRASDALPNLRERGIAPDLADRVRRLMTDVENHIDQLVPFLLGR